MTGFAGIVAFDRTAGDVRLEEWVARTTASRRERVVVRRVADAAFVQETDSGRIVAQRARGSAPEAVSGLLFAANGRLDNRAELGQALGIPPQDRAGTGDDELLLAMFRRWGDAGLARCLGAFVFALWDAKTRQLILARDCLGARALYFHRGRGHVAFATTYGALLSLPQVPREIDEITMVRFLALNASEIGRTFYRGVERVPSRTVVAIGQKEIRRRNYWSPNFDASPSCRRDEDYVERARELFDQAVAATTADTPHVAISTSGGLDSSAIAATAARLGRAGRVSCYTLVPPAGFNIDMGAGRYLDERDKVEALGSMHPALDLHFIADETSHPFETDDARLFARTNVPVLGPLNLGAFGHVHDAVVDAGHSVVQTGTYGNFGLTWDGRFSLPVLLRARQWGILTRETIALVRRDSRSPARTIASEIMAHAAPLWLARSIGRLRDGDITSISRWSAINPDYVAEHDLVRQWRAQGFDLWQGPRSGRDPARLRAHCLFDANQIARDANAATPGVLGFERRNPHADRRLLEFALSVPEPVYRRDGVPRSFARAVFADRLPPAILDERRRGAHAVNWFSRLSARRRDIEIELERLESSPLARRLIDLPRLKQLVARWPRDAQEAETRRIKYRAMLARAVHVGRFFRWVEGGNA